MGLGSGLQQYFKNRKTKKIQRYTRLVKNGKAMKEDRVGAIEFFKNHPDPNIAVPALLTRFEYSLEHGINDTREKEQTMAGIVSHGKSAVPIVRTHLAKTFKIAWPIKILEAVGSEEELVESLKLALNFGEVSFDLNANEKNYDLLCHLASHKIPGFSDTIAHFLKDPDERLRFAAAEVLLGQEDANLPQLLECFLSDTSSENRRLSAIVLSAFVSRGWRVSQPDKYENGQIVENYYVTKDGHVEKR